MAHRVKISNDYTSFSALIKLIIFVSIVVFASHCFYKSSNDSDTTNNPSSTVSGKCSEFRIWSLTNRRLHNRAYINESINGCVDIDLMGDYPFTLEFYSAGPAIHFDCTPLQNGVSVVAIKCPGMQKPIILDSNTKDYVLGGESCGQSPLKIYGTGSCTLKLIK